MSFCPNCGATHDQTSCPECHGLKAEWRPTPDPRDELIRRMRDVVAEARELRYYLATSHHLDCPGLDKALAELEKLK